MGYLLSKLSLRARITRAFSLLELMVALVILAIFASLAIPVFVGILNSSKAAHKATATTTTIAKVVHTATHPGSFITTFNTVIPQVGLGFMGLLVVVFFIAVIVRVATRKSRRPSLAQAHADLEDSLRSIKSARVATSTEGYAGNAAMVTSMASITTADPTAPIAHKPVGQITRKQQRAQRQMSTQPRFR